MKRREFLSYAALAGAGFSGRSLLSSESAGRRVIIVGAGMSGLSAGYELSRMGYQVTILEARKSPGGRVRTLRKPFSNNLHAEAGAFWIPGNDKLTLGYLNDFDIPYTKVPLSHLSSTYFVRNGLYRTQLETDVDWPFELTPEESRLGLSGMRSKYINPGIILLGEVYTGKKPVSSLARYDQMTFAEYLKGQGASNAAVELLRVGYFDLWGEGINSYSALQMLRDVIQGAGNTHFKITGGNDTLPREFARRLKGNIRYECQVTAIHQDDSAVRISYKTAGMTSHLHADYAVCTLPFPVLKGLAVTPSFSEKKRRAISELPYSSVTRIYLQCRRKFWLDQGLNGYVRTDLPIGMVGDASYDQNVPGGILESYQIGPQARRLADLSEQKKYEVALTDMEHVYPNIRENFIQGASVCWDEDPWAKGGYVWFKPGQLSDLFHQTWTAEGRVHFAGEHTSQRPGWIAGALSSANRVIKEITDRSA